jgi:hypothetical protein
MSTLRSVSPRQRDHSRVARSISKRRRSLVGLLASAGLASFHAGCSSAPDLEETTGTTAQAVTGDVSFDSTCTTPPATSPDPRVALADVPANVQRNIKIAEAYMRIAVNSPAFRECMAVSMERTITIGPSYYQPVTGPYLPCSGDPEPATVSGVMRHMLSGNSTRISCDYSTIGGSTGGYAGIGAIDESDRELFTFGNQLINVLRPANCTFNPDGAGCVNDGEYAASATTLAHELMHAHGYSHVSDAVNNRADLSVGDVDPGPPAYTFTEDDFCGITPGPGVHPTYGTSIPYGVGSCVLSVLEVSRETGRLHDECGAAFPGLNLVDSVVTTSSPPAMHCVRDPYTGTSDYSPLVAAESAPIPPHAPTCQLYPPCEGSSRASLVCSDGNANPVHLEGRRIGSTGAWTRTSSFSAAREYRACAESLYGKACSTPTVTPRLCLPKPPRMKPIPWWKQRPLGITPRFKSLAAARLGGGTMMAMAMTASEVADFPELGGASGDLLPDFAAFGIGLLNPDVGIVYARGASTGALPPGRGTAFALGVAPDGTPHLVGIGGDTPNGAPSAKLYDGKVAYDAKGIAASWAAVPMPVARTHASAASNLEGDTVFVFGGTTSKGVAGDLYSYGVASGAWTLLTGQAATPRLDAAMAVDGATAVIFGGRDAKGAPLGDLVTVDLKSGATRTLTTTAARANATIAVANGKLYVYGGEGTKGASDVLDVVALADGKLLSSTHVGVAASSGSGLAVDDEGLVTLVPGAVPNASLPGGAFVGLPGELVFVEQP